MKHIVSYSGGKGSFAAAARAIDWYGRDNVELVFADTLIEDEDLYRFLRETTEWLGVPFHWLQDGRTPWDVFRDVRFQGNNRIAPCSRILKTELTEKWIQARFKPEECNIHLGIDISEEHRLRRATSRWFPYVARAPLCEEPVPTPGYTEALLDAAGIKLPKLYELGFPHNNCGGFCVRTGQAQFATLLKTMPDRYQWHEEQQEALMRDVPNVKPFIRKTVKGVLTYLTLREFREHLEQNPEDYDKLAWGGCGCFIDDQIELEL